MSKSIVIVGGGVAGVSAAEELRKRGFTGDITIVSDEPGLPYDRPPLSKGYASGHLDEDEVLLRPIEWFDEQAVRHHQQAAGRLLPLTKSVELVDGSILKYDQLLLTTGARARTMLDLAPSSRILTLRSLEDARRFRSALQPGARLCLVGGGVIGMECAATAVRAGCRVTVLEAGGRIMARFAPPVISSFLAQAHRQEGVTIREGFQASTVTADDAGVIIQGSGEILEADWVLLGLGAIAEIGLAKAAGIATVAGGIKVDDAGRTSEADIYAAGDCAAFPEPGNGHHIRWENWTHARDHARAVARSMMGEAVAYAATCWVWSNQYDFNVQVTGQANAQTVLVRGNPGQAPFTTIHLDAGRVVGAATVNSPRDKRALHRLVEAKAIVPVELLQDISKPLSEIANSYV